MNDTESAVTDSHHRSEQSFQVPFRAGLILLWVYARPHVGKLMLSALLGLFATATALATPLVTKWVLDSLEARVELAVPVMVLVALLLIGTGAGFAQTVLLGRLAEYIVLDARRSLVQRFFRAKLQQAQRFTSGELVTRVTSDTVLLREATTSSIVQIINGTVSLVGTVVLMAILDWPMLLTTLAALAVIGTLFGLFLPKIGSADKQTQDSIGELGAALEGGMRALRTVKSSRAETREAMRISAKAEDAARHSMRSVWYTGLTWAIAGGGVQFAIIVILGVGAGRVALGELAVSTLVAFLLYAFNIVDPISSLAGAFASLQSGLAAAARIRETQSLDEEMISEDSNPEDRAPAGPEVPVLALRNVTAGYEGVGHPALRGVTLEIPRTGHVALVGPSGAGKTTVFSLLLRFLDPANGTLELDGVDYERWSIDDVRSRIAYVEQETPIIPGTVRQNVLFRVFDEASESEAWAALEAVRLDQKVRSLPEGLDAEVSEANISGGERQRLAVARALVRRPEVLLLDEATAQLDGSTESAIQRAIAAAAQAGAVVTIAHRLSTVLDADRIIVLDRGRVRDSGRHHELLTRDSLYQEFVAALRIGEPAIGRSNPGTEASGERA